jgi:hypothetical protein
MAAIGSIWLEHCAVILEAGSMMKEQADSGKWSPNHLNAIKKNHLARLALFALGAALIWLGPSLSDFGALHGAWCLSSGASIHTQLSQLAWHATQHCPYCYIGAAIIIFACVATDFNCNKQALRTLG